MKGISTIIATIMMVVITIGLISVAYLYMSGLITSRTVANIQLVDAFCTSRTLNMLIKNIGTTAIDPSKMSFVVRGSNVTNINCDMTSLAAGVSMMCKNLTIMSPNQMVIGPNELRVIGPSNAVGGTVNC